MGQVGSKSYDFNLDTSDFTDEGESRGLSPLPTMKKEPVVVDLDDSESASEAELEVRGNLEGMGASGSAINATPSAGAITSLHSARVAAVKPTVSTSTDKVKVDDGCNNHVGSENLANVEHVSMVTNEEGGEAIISIAPRERWSESASDDEMEEGEVISSDGDERGSSQCSAWGGKKKAVLNSWSSSDCDEKVRKRRKLDVSAIPNGSNSESLTSSSGDQSGIMIEFDRLLESSSQEGESNEDQQQSIQNPLRLRGVRAEEESLLIPLFREVIDAERKKKAELEDENKKLKSMLAKVTLEKEETFQLLRQSNKTLTDVTDASAVLEKRVEDLTSELAEKNSLIKVLRKETSAVRGMLSRINKTLDDMDGKGSSTSRSIGNDGGRTEERNVSGSRACDRARAKSKDSKSIIPLMDLKPLDKTEQKSSVSAGNSAPSKMSSCSDEELIMTKLQGLKKWAYSIQDIKKIDGKWRCPECGDTKYTLFATAAHARDKHVWKIGAGLKPRLR